MSKVRLKKPTLCDDIMYGTDSIIDMKDEGRVRYFVDMGQVERVDESTPLTAVPPPLPPKRNEQADDIGNAVGRAILKVLNLPKDQDAA
jgi:hypothetical protein